MILILRFICAYGKNGVGLYSLLSEPVADSGVDLVAYPSAGVAYCLIRTFDGGRVIEWPVKTLRRAEDTGTSFFRLAADDNHLFEMNPAEEGIDPFRCAISDVDSDFLHDFDHRPVYPGFGYGTRTEGVEYFAGMPVQQCFADLASCGIACAEKKDIAFHFRPAPYVLHYYSMLSDES